MSISNLATYIIILSLQLQLVFSDYDCLCYYGIEKEVYSNAQHSGVVGYLYEFDCKPLIGRDADGHFGVAFDHQFGYIEKGDGNLQIQVCPGAPPASDILPTTPAPTVISTSMLFTTKPSTSSMKHTSRITSTLSTISQTENAANFTVIITTRATRTYTTGNSTLPPTTVAINSTSVNSTAIFTTNASRTASLTTNIATTLPPTTVTGTSTDNVRNSTESVYTKTTYMDVSTTMIIQTESAMSSTTDFDSHTSKIPIVNSSYITTPTTTVGKTIFPEDCLGKTTTNTEYSINYTGRVDLCPYQFLAESIYDNGMYPLFRQHGHYCYEFRNVSNTWYQAERDCQHRGGYLVSIHDYSTLTLLEEFRRNSDPATDYWIGLTNALGIWKWSNGDPFVCSANGNFPQPNSSDSCILMSAVEGSWKLSKCSSDDTKAPWICQYNIN